MTTHTQATRHVTRQALELMDWAQIGALAAVGSMAMVVIMQALALALWPEAARFKPLDSYLRSALFTLVPAVGATFVFAHFARRAGDPVPAFVRVAVVVLLVSFVPDYLLPDPNKTLLASSVAAFLHLVAGMVTVGVLVAGYRHKMGQCAAQQSRP